MQMRESKADQALAMEGICIIVSDIVRATAFLHQAVTSCNLNRTNVRLFQINRVSINTLSDLGVLSNLIGSLSLAYEYYSPPTE